MRPALGRPLQTPDPDAWKAPGPDPARNLDPWPRGSPALALPCGPRARRGHSPCCRRVKPNSTRRAPAQRDAVPSPSDGHQGSPRWSELALTS
ncbi:hypothetical protein NN561_014315 [Cricetulus griseus]